MKRLTLIRHAKADDAASADEDWNRPLAPKGERDARRMAERLKDRELMPDAILTSPALRAITTARVMARVLGFAEKKIITDEQLYLAQPKKIIEIVRAVDARFAHVMVFGHNPGITECADLLSSERPIDAMPTASVFTAEFDIQSWNELAESTGTDVDLDYPDRTS